MCFYGGHSTGYKLGNHPKNIEPCAHRARTVRAPCDNAPLVRGLCKLYHGLNKAKAPAQPQHSPCIVPAALRSPPSRLSLVREACDGPLLYRSCTPATLPPATRDVWGESKPLVVSGSQDRGCNCTTADAEVQAPVPGLWHAAQAVPEPSYNVATCSSSTLGCHGRSFQGADLGTQ